MTERNGKRRRGRSRRLFGTLLVLVLLVGFFYFEQTAISEETIEEPITLSAFDGFRISVLSDVHGAEFGEGNARLLKRVAAQKPDIIALIGDLVHDTEQFDMVPALAKGLSAIAPTYYVTGNHEWAAGDVPALKELLRANGVQVLSNEYVVFEREGQKLALLGADDLNGHADQKTVPELAQQVREAEGEQTYQLLLSHRNNRYETYAEAQVDLTLAGHAHGGQVRLPFTDGLIGPHREFLPHYTAGRYALEYGDMIVSRGLSDQFPAFRLFNRPDLPLVILRAAV